MPVTQGSPVVVNLSQKLAEQMESGGLAAARASFGAKDAAFSWTTGLPRGLWTFVNTASVEGGSFQALLVAPSGTPVAPVSPGSAKPNAVTLTPTTVTLVKYAGYADFTAEQGVYSDVLPQAIGHTLVAQAMAALETACIGVITSGAGSTITGDTNWTTAVLKGISAVAGLGGTPDVLVIGPADFAKAVTQPTQLTFNGTDDIPTYLGLKLHLSPKAAAGVGFVLDSSSVTVAESVASPMAVLDSFSQAKNNKSTLVVDVMAAAVVTGPAGVVKLTPTVAGTEAASAEKTSTKK